MSVGETLSPATGNGAGTLPRRTLLRTASRIGGESFPIKNETPSLIRAAKRPVILASVELAVIAPLVWWYEWQRMNKFRRLNVINVGDFLSYLVMLPPRTLFARSKM